MQDLIVLSTGRSHINHGMSRCVAFSIKHPSYVASRAACCLSENHRKYITLPVDKYVTKGVADVTYERRQIRQLEVRSFRNIDTVVRPVIQHISDRTDSTHKTEPMCLNMHIQFFTSVFLKTYLIFSF